MVRISVQKLAEEILEEVRWMMLSFIPSELEDEYGNAGTDCRLRIFEGDWQLLSGDPQYDTDHRGEWSHSFIPYDCDRTQAIEIAKELINDNDEAELMDDASSEEE